MQREIKFRAFHDKEKCFWHFGLAELKNDKRIDKDWFRLQEKQQYTGLKDKDGKEIYEGDILAYYHIEADEISHNPVTFKDGCFMTGILDLCPLIEDLEYKTLFEITVVGNIYENPELLHTGGDGIKT